MSNINRKLPIVFIIVGISGFLLVLYTVLIGNAANFDDPVRNFFYNLRIDWLTGVFKVITYLGNWQSITLLCLLLLLFKPTRKTYGVPVSIGAASVTIINKIVKSIVQRPRPDDIVHLVHAGGFSFPSGHSITSMFVFGILIYLIQKHVKNSHTANIITVILIIPMICIGLSRIYLGVHYPTDVLAGWCLGFAMISVSVLIINMRRS